MRFRNLLGLSLVCGSLALTACGNAGEAVVKDIVLKVLDDYHGECEISIPIDMGYFFYCSDKKAMSINVKYNNGRSDVTEKVNGEIYIPQFAGKHVFTCSAGNKSVSKEVNVLDQKPFISVDSSTYFHVVDPKYPEIYLDDLTQNISCTISPKSAWLRLDKVEYSPFNLNIDKEDLVFTEIPFIEDHFTASNRGHYKVYVSSVNGSRSAPGMFNVIVDTNLNNGNEYVKKWSETRYCSTRVVVDESNPNAFLLPAADYKRGASFVTLKDEWEYTDNTGKTIPHETVIKFKGKHLPTIGIYTQPDSISGSFSNTAIRSGFIISWEQNNLPDRYSVTRGSSTFIYKTVYSNHPEYSLGIQDLDDDTYYRLTIGVKTMENKNGDYTHLHAVGWDIRKIVNYGTAEETYERIPDQYGNYRDQYLPYDAGGWWDKNPDNKGYVTFYSSTLQDITFEVEHN